uniref:(northern house mosquito) hypothetical protein n=1 Tax=Culex pipiens TaxID=7175 RepID=A0A8D8IAB2_CULPI
MVSSRDLDPIWDLAFGRRVESAVGFHRNGGDFIRSVHQHLWRDSNLQVWKEEVLPHLRDRTCASRTMLPALPLDLFDRVALFGARNSRIRSWTGNRCAATVFDRTVTVEAAWSGRSSGSDRNNGGCSARTDRRTRSSAWGRG